MEELIPNLIDQSGVLALGVLILLRLDRSLTALSDKIDRLIDAVRETPRR